MRPSSVTSPLNVSGNNRQVLYVASLCDLAKFSWFKKIKIKTYGLKEEIVHDSLAVLSLQKTSKTKQTQLQLQIKIGPQGPISS